MIDIEKELHELLELPTPNSIEIKVNPDLSIHVSPETLDKKKDVIVRYCQDIPKVDREGFPLFIRHTKQCPFLGQLLLAVGEHYKIWKRFPELYIPWNLPVWPYALDIESPDESEKD